VFRRIEGRQDRPCETERVAGVLDVNDAVLLFQPLRGFEVARAMKWTILCYTNNKFSNTIQNVATATRVPVVGFAGQVGGDGLQVQLLCFIDVLDLGGKVGGDALMTVFCLSGENGVDPHV